MIRIAGLGPAGIENISISALLMLESSERLFLRTGRHPAARDLEVRGIRFETFDRIYEESEDFEDVYRTISEAIIKEARKGDVTYAVPGHPLIGERSVGLILEIARKEGIPVTFAGSESFVEVCLEALAEPIGRGLKIIDALAIATVPPSPDCPNLIYQVYDRIIASEVKLALMKVYPDEFEVCIIAMAGKDEMKVEKLPLYEMDHRDYDHLTSVYVPMSTNLKADF